MNNYIYLIIIIISILVIKYIYINRYENFSIPNKPILKLKLGSTFYIPNDIYKERHHMQSLGQFIKYFLPNKYRYKLVMDDEKSDITIWDIYIKDNSNLRDDEINILICVENVNYWNWYKHNTKYGNYGDNKMDIYLYNHIDRINKTENYIGIPMIHYYINYYLSNKNKIMPSEIIPFTNKKFCLLINKSKLNPEINNIYTILNKIDVIDSISIYENIVHSSCYHSVDLLNVFNKYKFIICYENSYTDGYITEKIFNCFFAHTIPIYKGSEKINDYINNKSFIDARNDNMIDLVIKLKDDENMYNEYINSNKISNNYNNENYNNEMITFIDSKLKK